MQAEGAGGALAQVTPPALKVDPEHEGCAFTTL